LEYSALNRADIMMREGRYPNQKEPRPLGLEGAGKVVKLGKNAENALEVGDSVMCLFPGGGHVEFKNVNFKHVLKVPKGMSMETAGGTMEVWLTAFQLLHKVASLKEGDTIFVHAAASGVGTSLIQLAKLQNAKVIASASSNKKLEFVKNLGADLTGGTQSFI